MGSSWGRLGAVKGRPGGVLVLSWGVLGASVGVLELSWGVLGLVLGRWKGSKHYACRCFVKIKVFEKMRCQEAT